MKSELDLLPVSHFQKLGVRADAVTFISCNYHDFDSAQMQPCFMTFRRLKYHFVDADAIFCMR